MMSSLFTTISIPGAEALAELEKRREAYPKTGQYPFLIGDSEELERISEAAEFNDQNPEQIIQASLGIDLDEWIAKRRAFDEEDYGFSVEPILGEWPDEILEKGSIGLHRDILTGKIKPEVYLGTAAISQPWHLPAVLKYGGWNDCPAPEVQCAFHRKWQAEFGVQITGMSGDVVECLVTNPPLDHKSAIELAWQQYWYCADIVEQGCESINNLAATLLDSSYWYFWWD